MRYCWKYISFRPQKNGEYAYVSSSCRFFLNEKECIEDGLRNYPTVSYFSRPVLCVKEYGKLDLAMPFSKLSDRLKTYEFWPPAIPISPQSLADAGFYYEGIGDRVTCFNCKKTIMKWKADDDPWFEHRRHSPYCAYI